LIIADGCWVASACCAPRMSLRRCFLGALAVLSASIVVLAMSGGVAAAAPDTKRLLEVDKIAEVDFGRISGTRVGAVSVCTTSDCKVLFTAQDALHFAWGGASDARAKQNLAAIIKADGVPEGFHRGRWKPVNGPREGGIGSWSVSLSTLKGFVKTQVLLARQSAALGGAGARSLATHLHVQVRDMNPPPPQPQPARVRVYLTFLSLGVST
jgi:hypothetical protein